MDYCYPSGISYVDYVEHLIHNASIKSFWYDTMGIDKEECAQRYGCKHCQCQLEMAIVRKQSENGCYRIAMQGHAYGRIMGK